jgi:uncharacterized membrane protein
MKAPLRILACCLFGLVYLYMAHRAATLGQPAELLVLVGCAPLSLALLGLLWQTRLRWSALALIALLAGLLYRQAEALVAHAVWLYFLQDTGSNLLGCVIFARSLLPGQEALCSRMARFARGGALTPYVARYTYILSFVWAAYFAGCAALGAALFLSGHVEAWSWFANVLTWPLTALLFLLEYPVRLCLVPRAERATLAETVRGIIASSKAQAAGRPS